MIRHKNSRAGGESQGRSVQALDGPPSFVGGAGVGQGVGGGPSPGEGPPPSPEEGTPPLLTGGVLQLQDISRIYSEQHSRVFTYSLQGEGVDFLTATIHSDLVEVSGLLARTVEDEAGRAVAGFECSERRQCMGGECWRRYKPRQASKVNGLRYESWEWAGESSRFAASDLRGVGLKPTRVDVAFDLSVPADFMADDLAEMVKPWAKLQGIGEGISGQNGVNTRYFGSINSPRRVRIYRKDLEDEAWAARCGPTLRVEVILKDEHAVKWWDAWCESERAGLELAAGHVLEMLGFQVRDEFADVPTIDASADVDLVNSVAALYRQYGDLLGDLLAVGYPLLDQVHQREQGASRMRRSRSKKRRKAIEEYGVESLAAVVEGVMANGS